MPSRPPLAPGLYERLITNALKAELDALEREGTSVVHSAAHRSRRGARHARAAHRSASSPARCEDCRRRSARRASRRSPTASSSCSRGDGETKDSVAHADAVVLPPDGAARRAPAHGRPGAGPRPPAPAGPALRLRPPRQRARRAGARSRARARDPSADSIDLLCAFVRWHGLRVLMDPLTAHCRAGKPLARHHHRLHRVHRAQGAGLAAEPRRAGEGVLRHRSPRACMPRRGCSGARPATPPPTSGRRTCRSPRCSTAWSGTCGCRRWARRTCWRSSTRRSRATGPARNTRTTREPPSRRPASIAPCRANREDTLDAPLTFLDVKPWPHQREILEKLDAERKRHQPLEEPGGGRHRHGQDDRRRARLQAAAQREAAGPRPAPAVRGAPAGDPEAEPRRVPPGAASGDFGELYVDGDVPDEWRHVFGSVQSLSQMDFDRLKPDAFDVVIVDEFHRAGAPTYTKLLEHLTAEGAARAHRHA